MFSTVLRGNRRLGCGYCSLAFIIAPSVSIRSSVFVPGSPCGPAGQAASAKISGLRSSSSDGHRRGRLRQGLPSGPWVHRACELRDAASQNGALVVEHLGRITGYTTGIAFFGHSVAETNQDLMALIGAAPEFGGPGFLLPTRNHEVFKWCLEAGLKLASQMTLMTMGLYNEPAPGHICRLLSIDAKRIGVRTVGSGAAESGLACAVQRRRFPVGANACVYRKLKLGRSGDAVRPGWRMN